MVLQNARCAAACLGTQSDQCCHAQARDVDVAGLQERLDGQVSMSSYTIYARVILAVPHSMYYHDVRVQLERARIIAEVVFAAA